MAGVQNNTARLLNLKAHSNGVNHKVHLKPGFNVVEDSIWDVVKKSPYVQALDKEGTISFNAKGKETKETAAQSKSAATPKPRKAAAKKKKAAAKKKLSN